MNRDILVQWLRDRRDNCVRLSKEKFGADREAWIEDAQFFNWALQVAQNMAVPAMPKELPDDPQRDAYDVGFTQGWNSAIHEAKKLCQKN
jgi:hypothetical protein